VILDRTSDINPDDTSGLGIVPETVVYPNTAIIRLVARDRYTTPPNLSLLNTTNSKLYSSLANFLLK
jgi:hypothetical protein